MNHNMYVSGVTEIEVKSTEEAYSIFWKGELIYTQAPQRSAFWKIQLFRKRLLVKVYVLMLNGFMGNVSYCYFLRAKTPWNPIRQR